ncbi:MAG: endopeptidase La [Clostridia bacterium]
MQDNIINNIPTVALRGLVAFPTMMLHFEVGREKSIAAIQAAMKENQQVFLVAQKSVTYEDPTPKQLYSMGILANVKQIIKSPDSPNLRVVIEGVQRASLIDCSQSDPYIVSDIKLQKSKSIRLCDEEYAQAITRVFKECFEEYALHTDKQASDVAMEVFQSKDVDYLSDFIAGNAVEDFAKRQELLSELSPINRIEKLLFYLTNEIQFFELEESIHAKVQEQIDKGQQEYYLREQLKVISDALGDGDELKKEIDGFKAKISKAKMPEEVSEKLLKECDKLSKMQTSSPDANIARAYLDASLNLPWGKFSKDNFDLSKAKKTLDKEHFGLEKVKDKFIEMLAVKKISDDVKGQIVCLVGPPGVGKTSIVKSIAKAMGRKYTRISLGGVHDEAEIRGHRKTYIGAMQGRIASALESAKTFNPIILLDEIDKLANDHRGDPASALLEALDPEQNFSFRDNFLEFPLDLSKVLFITTANDYSTIPPALFDRMDIIELTSYTPEEKFNIAKKHLLKKQLKLHGLTATQVKIPDASLHFIIDSYTREAGVRRLEKTLVSVIRKCIVKMQLEDIGKIIVSKELIVELLGPEKYSAEKLLKTDTVGVVNGLAWTSVGGELLQVEAVVMDGSGKLEITGNLGKVMSESAKAAHSYIRSVATLYDIDKDVFKNKDIHIHVPQGAVPKDGPSAGVTISTALLSALSGKGVVQSIAMTGEISLTGRVMPIGGLKEKSMAAYKSGVKKVLIPWDNKADLYEVDQVVKDNVEFVCVKSLDEVFAHAINDVLPRKKASKTAKKAVKMSVDTTNSKVGIITQ